MTRVSLWKAGVGIGAAAGAATVEEWWTVTGVDSSSKGCTDRARRENAIRPALLLLTLVVAVKRRRIIIAAWHRVL
jgi:hypothetical protein